jgi:hypothetical protein
MAEGVGFVLKSPFSKTIFAENPTNSSRITHHPKQCVTIFTDTFTDSTSELPV